MDNDRIVKKIYSKIEEVPTLSPVLQKIVALLGSSTSGAQEITDVVARDPAMTSKILKVANSAYYGFAQQVNTLDRAVAILGFNMIRSLSMSIGIMRALPPGKKSGRFSIERLWIHSLAVATLMKELAARCGRKEEGEFLFVVGLLHDIGKVVLDQYFDEEYQQSLEETGCLESISVCEAEVRCFGMDHGEVGSILLKRWNFPVAICSLVAQDHKTEIPEDINPSYVAMLHIADILAKEAGMGVSESIAASEISKSDIDATGLSSEDIDNARSYLIEAKEGIKLFFSSLG